MDNQFLHNAEEQAEIFFKKAKKFIPTIARLLLVATFIDEGLRMWTHYGEQAHFFQRRYPTFIVHLIIWINLVLQLAGSGMIMVRKHVEIAVGMLSFIVIFQVCACVRVGDPESRGAVESEIDSPKARRTLSLLLLGAFSGQRPSSHY